LRTNSLIPKHILLDSFDLKNPDQSDQKNNHSTDRIISTFKAEHLKLGIDM